MVQKVLHVQACLSLLPQGKTPLPILSLPVQAPSLPHDTVHSPHVHMSHNCLQLEIASQSNHVTSQCPQALQLRVRRTATGPLSEDVKSIDVAKTH